MRFLGTDRFVWCGVVVERKFLWKTVSPCGYVNKVFLTFITRENLRVRKVTRDSYVEGRRKIIRS